MTNPGGRGWSGNEKALDRGEGLLVLLLLLCLRRGMARNLGAPGWDRTSNPCLRRAVLYPLSYGRQAQDYRIAWRDRAGTAFRDEADPYNRRVLPNQRSRSRGLLS